MFWWEAAASCGFSQLWVAVERRVITGGAGGGEPCLSGDEETGAEFLHGSGAGVRVGLLARGRVLVGSEISGNRTWLSF